jgi:hypothetical protein
VPLIGNGGDSGVADIGVVYLYRFAEGELTARAFLASYRGHPAGVDHDLHVIFKGFPDKGALTSARAIFAGLPINAIELDDKGFDMGAYFAAAKVIPDRRLVFFNTFTGLLADDWLKIFDKALSLPGVGLVGATGSWQSLSSYYEVLIRLGRGEIGRLQNYLTRLAMRVDHSKGAQGGRGAQAVQGLDEGGNTAALSRGLYLLLRLDQYLFYLYEFGRFPNPHIRTNGFMIERDRFLSLRAPAFRTKFDLYKFESGRQSMTKQIIAQGLRPIVVDRNSSVYDIPEWESSSTYWVDQQANLIAEDNRTRQYESGSQERRRRLHDYAWVHPASWTLDVHRLRLIHDLS